MAFVPKSDTIDDEPILIPRDGGRDDTTPTVYTYSLTVTLKTSDNSGLTIVNCNTFSLKNSSGIQYYPSSSGNIATYSSLVEGVYTLNIVEDGYSNYTTSIAISGKNSSITVILQKKYYHNISISLYSEDVAFEDIVQDLYDNSGNDNYFDLFDSTVYNPNSGHNFTLYSIYLSDYLPIIESNGGEVNDIITTIFPNLIAVLQEDYNSLPENYSFTFERKSSTGDGSAANPYNWELKIIYTVPTPDIIDYTITVIDNENNNITSECSLSLNSSVNPEYNSEDECFSFSSTEKNIQYYISHPNYNTYSGTITSSIPSITIDNLKDKEISVNINLLDNRDGEIILSLSKIIYMKNISSPNINISGIGSTITNDKLKYFNYSSTFTYNTSLNAEEIENNNITISYLGFFTPTEYTISSIVYLENEEGETLNYSNIVKKVDIYDIDGNPIESEDNELKIHYKESLKIYSKSNEYRNSSLIRFNGFEDEDNKIHIILKYKTSVRETEKTVAIPWDTEKINVHLELRDRKSNKSKNLDIFNYPILSSSNISCYSSNKMAKYSEDSESGDPAQTVMVNPLFVNISKNIDGVDYSFKVQLYKEVYPADMIIKRDNLSTIDVHKYIESSPIEFRYRVGLEDGNGNLTENSNTHYVKYNTSLNNEDYIIQSDNYDSSNGINRLTFINTLSSDEHGKIVDLTISPSNEETHKLLSAKYTLNLLAENLEFNLNTENNYIIYGNTSIDIDDNRYTFYQNGDKLYDNELISTSSKYPEVPDINITTTTAGIELNELNNGKLIISNIDTTVNTNIAIPITFSYGVQQPHSEYSETFNIPVKVNPTFTISENIPTVETIDSGTEYKINGKPTISDLTGCPANFEGYNKDSLKFYLITKKNKEYTDNNDLITYSINKNDSNYTKNNDEIIREGSTITINNLTKESTYYINSLSGNLNKKNSSVTKAIDSTCYFIGYSHSDRADVSYKYIRDAIDKDYQLIRINTINNQDYSYIIDTSYNYMINSGISNIDKYIIDNTEILNPSITYKDNTINVNFSNNIDNSTDIYVGGIYNLDNELYTYFYNSPGNQRIDIDNIADIVEYVKSKNNYYYKCNSTTNIFSCIGTSISLQVTHKEGKKYQLVLNGINNISNYYNQIRDEYLTSIGVDINNYISFNPWDDNVIISIDKLHNITGVNSTDVNKYIDFYNGHSLDSSLQNALYMKVKYVNSVDDSVSNNDINNEHFKLYYDTNSYIDTTNLKTFLETYIDYNNYTSYGPISTIINNYSDRLTILLNTYSFIKLIESHTFTSIYYADDTIIIPQEYNYTIDSTGLHLANVYKNILLKTTDLLTNTYTLYNEYVQYLINRALISNGDTSFNNSNSYDKWIDLFNFIEENADPDKDNYLSFDSSDGENNIIVKKIIPLNNTQETTLLVNILKNKTNFTPIPNENNEIIHYDITIDNILYHISLSFYSKIDAISVIPTDSDIATIQARDEYSYLLDIFSTTLYSSILKDILVCVYIPNFNDYINYTLGIDSNSSTNLTNYENERDKLILSSSILFDTDSDDHYNDGYNNEILSIDDCYNYKEKYKDYLVTINIKYHLNRVTEMQNRANAANSAGQDTIDNIWPSNKVEEDIKTIKKNICEYIYINKKDNNKLQCKVNSAPIILYNDERSNINIYYRRYNDCIIYYSDYYSNGVYYLVKYTINKDQSEFTLNNIYDNYNSLKLFTGTLFLDSNYVGKYIHFYLFKGNSYIKPLNIVQSNIVKTIYNFNNPIELSNYTFTNNKLTLNFNIPDTITANGENNILKSVEYFIYSFNSSNNTIEKKLNDEIMYYTFNVNKEIIINNLDTEKFYILKYRIIYREDSETIYSKCKYDIIFTQDSEDNMTYEKVSIEGNRETTEQNYISCDLVCCTSNESYWWKYSLKDNIFYLIRKFNDNNEISKISNYDFVSNYPKISFIQNENDKKYIISNYE